MVSISFQAKYHVFFNETNLHGNESLIFNFSIAFWKSISSSFTTFTS